MMNSRLVTFTDDLLFRRLFAAIVVNQHGVKNAADVLDVAFANQVEGHPHFDESLFGPIFTNEVLTSCREEGLPCWQELVASNTFALAKVREAVAIDGYYRSLDFSQGPDRPLPHTGDSLRMDRVLVTDSRCAVRHGNYAQVTTNLFVVCRLSEMMHTEPILICQLVGLAHVNQAVGMVRDALNEGNPTEEDLVAWNNILRQHAEPRSLLDGIVFHFATGNEFFVNGWWYSEYQADPFDMYRFLGFVALDHRAFVGLYRALFERASEPDPDWRAIGGAFERQRDELPGPHVFAKILAGLFGGLV